MENEVLKPVVTGDSAFYAVDDGEWSFFQTVGEAADRCMVLLQIGFGNRGRAGRSVAQLAFRQVFGLLLPPASSFQAFELDFKTTDFAPLVDALGLAIGFSKKGEWAED